MFKAKSYYEQNLINGYLQSKDSNIFHCLKNITKSHSLPSFLQLGSTVFEEDLDKANALNEYFNSAFSQSSFVLPDINDLPSVPDSLSDITVTLEDVYQALTSLQPNKHLVQIILVQDSLKIMLPL